ncbi:MAG: L-threonylcarbamoyladenylate synthase [Polaribacter sp.]|nr:L-threonylcarbamoyladenylate synthase [Polaribacter sp.]
MAKFIKIYNDNPNQQMVDEVVAVLKKGGLVIFPTDTIYGLGCDLKNNKALERLAMLKGVKLEKATFSFIFNNLSHLSDYVKQLDSPTFKILKRTLPGPYTFILPGSNTLPKVFKKKKTVGIRIPNNNIVRSIIETLGNPIVSTSIKDEDEILEYITDPELIFEKWEKKVDIVIDGGYGDNYASTVVDLIDVPVVIREGKGRVDVF